ncbi:hypothetical protein TNCV_1845611 [Trichonephila clavipes]|nr:hypothetical protein TNCV_1845611 [Trichonephila clavipes]
MEDTSTIPGKLRFWPFLKPHARCARSGYISRKKESVKLPAGLASVQASSIHNNNSWHLTWGLQQQQQQQKVCRGYKGCDEDCCLTVLGKVLHYAERWVAQCVAMVPLPIVSDGWVDTNNGLVHQISNNSDHYHHCSVNVSLATRFGWYCWTKVVWSDSSSILSLPSRNYLCHSKTPDLPMAASPNASLIMS